MSLLDRAKNIILTPQTEWSTIAAETPNVQGIITGYVLPLALITPVASFIGGAVMSGATSSLGATYLIGVSVVTFITSILSVYIAAYVIDYLAPNFGSEKNFGRSFQLVAYTATPGWVAGIFQIVPALGVLAMVAGLYGIYVMYLGLPVMKKTPADKVVVYMIVSFIVLLAATFILTAIFTSIILGILGVGAITSGVLGR
jgi:hypothetical protein